MQGFNVKINITGPHQLINIKPNSPGSAAGLREGDYLLSVDDENVTEYFHWKVILYLQGKKTIRNLPIKLVVRSELTINEIKPVPPAPAVPIPPAPNAPKPPTTNIPMAPNVPRPATPNIPIAPNFPNSPALLRPNKAATHERPVTLAPNTKFDTKPNVRFETRKNYEVEKLLGSGAFGSAYLVTDRNSQIK